MKPEPKQSVAGDARSLPGRRGAFARVDVLILICLVALAAGQAFTAQQATWERDSRIQCALNLRTIGQAMRQYAIDDVRMGNYPRTLYDPKTAEQPKFGSPYEGKDLGPKEGVDPFIALKEPQSDKELVQYGPEPNDVTASFYHLMRVSDLTPAHFICPSTRRQPLNLGAEEGVQESKLRYTNWPGHAALRDHLGFSFQNMYFPMDAIGRGAKWADVLPSTYAVAADMNPGTEALLKLKRTDVPSVNRSQDVRPADYNSPNHFGYGQNILFADGSVRFETSPFAGPMADNIYTFRDQGRTSAGGPAEFPSAGIVGPAFDANDNVLLPTAALLKQEPPKMPTDEEIAAMKRERSEPNGE